MKTLRQAAQALCDRWDTPLWKDVAPTAVFIGELRAAIKQEEAQTVEPAGEVGCDDWCQHPNMGTIAFLPKALPTGAKLFTHTAPATESAKPSAGERNALVAHCNEASVRASRLETTKSAWDFVQEAKGLLKKCADMLAADAQWEKLCDPAILHANLLRGLPAQLSKEQLLHLLGTDAPAELAQQVAVPQGWRLIEVTKLEQIAESWDECSYDAPGESIDIGEALRYAFFLLSAAPHPPQADHPEVELSDGEIYSRMSKAIDARLNIRVPMTDDEIYEAWDEIPDQLSLLEEIILLARAIEQFHGIGVKP